MARHGDVPLALGRVGVNVIYDDPPPARHDGPSDTRLP